jgi:hypothetical protein
MRSRSILSPLLVGAALAMSVVATSHVARAQEVEVEVVRQPPPQQVEYIPARPSPNHFWIHGNWGWNGSAHYWNPGRYEIMRPGFGWSESHWVGTGHGYHYYPGHWYGHR